MPVDYEALLAESFGIGPVSVQRLVGGALTTAYRVLGEDGGPGFVALVHHEPFGRSHVEAMHEVRLRLAESRVPVSAPMTAVDGSTMLETEDGLVELADWVPHDGFCIGWDGLPAAA